MPKSKWSTQKLMQRNYTGVSASQQLHRFEQAAPKGPVSSGSTKAYIPEGIDPSAPWYELRTDENGYQHLYCKLCKGGGVCVDEWHVKTDKHKYRESHPQEYAGNWQDASLDAPQPEISTGGQLVPVSEPDVDLEPWQELRDHGVYCKCCSSFFDEAHAQSEKHKRRLDDWLWAQNIQEAGAPAPAQPWLCYQTNPDWPETLSLRCLMCKKWVDDWEEVDTSEYCGAHGFPGAENSKDHRKKLANLTIPEHEDWWEERLRCHPAVSAGIEDFQQEVQLEGSGDESLRSTVAGEEEERVEDDEDSAEEVVYHLQASGELPAGWNVALDDEGDPYYYHDDGRAQWEHPLAAEP